MAFRIPFHSPVVTISLGTAFSGSRLTKMPEKWLQQLMVHTDAKGQTVDDDF